MAKRGDNCINFLVLLFLLCFSAVGCDGVTDKPDVAEVEPAELLPPGSTANPTATNLLSENDETTAILDSPTRSSSGEKSSGMDSKAATREVLKYNFTPTRYESYLMDIKVGGESSKSITGFSSFKAKPASKTEVEIPEIKGTGTAWAITEDGYLMTCAHVVENAREITVTIEDKTYPATLIAADSHIDLAIVKIPATNLTPLILAADKSCEQGQEVRSAGFPLSSVLGETIKINRGTIAGFVSLEGRDLVQIDVPINPGNSGGPVVDLYGNVIGVASEKLAGEEISSVGFCVPSHVVRSWAADYVKLHATGPSGVEMSGTELSKKISPSVALVKSTVGGISRNVAAHVIEGLGHYSVSNNDPLAIFSGIDSIHDQGSLIMDEFGTVIDQKGCQQLPFLLGPLAALALPTLSSDGAARWKTEEVIQVAASSEEEVSQDPLEALLLRRFRHGFGRRPSQRVVTLVSATKVEHFRIVSQDPQYVKIEKRWEIASEALPGVGFSIGCTGNGTWTFDRTLGLMTDFAGDANYTLSQEGSQLSLPMEIKVTRYTDELEKTIAAKQYESSTPASSSLGSSGSTASTVVTSMSPGQSSSNEPADSKLQAAINDLRGNADRATKLVALDYLATISINPGDRLAVIEALTGNLMQPDAEMKAKTLRALSLWDTATMVSQVIGILKDKDAMVVEAAIEYLGSAGDVAAADALGDLAKNKEQCRESAMRALTKLGPGAEEVVLDLARSTNTDLRRAACKVLGKIGGGDSITYLKKLAASKTAASADAIAALAELGVTYNP